MRIYLQDLGSDKQAPRFYHLHLAEDLLEGWTLVHEWGYQGGAGRIRRDHFSDRETAIRAMVTSRDRQIGKGYQIMFVQGMENTQ